MSMPRSAPPSAALAPVPNAALWLPTLALIGLALGLFAIGFHREASGALRVWIGSTAYNHCFLILPIVFYLLWERRSVWQASAPRPALWPLTLMPLLAALWFVVAALDVNEGRQLLVVAMFEVVLLAALGPLLFRALLAPLLFLFFLVPFGEFLVPKLQAITAAMSVAGLRLFHVPVYIDRFLIDIPEGSFVIAEACAGLRFLIASTVFSCLFAVVMYRGWLRRGVYIALSIAAAIAANGVRAWGIIMLAHLVGSAAAVETDHILYGWLFFSLVILLLIGIGLLMAEKPGMAAAPPPLPPARPAPRWRGLAVPLAALLALGGPAYAAWRNSQFAGDSLAAAPSPAIAAPWQAVSGGKFDWRPETRGAGREFLQTFAAPDGVRVTRFVALYPLRATGNELTSTGNRVADGRQWHVERRSRASFSLAGRRVPVTSTELVGRAGRRLVWSFYVVGGRIAAGRLQAKLLQLRATLAGGRPVGAFVAVAANMDDPNRPAARQLARFLAASRSLPRYVEGLARSPVAAGGS